MHCNISQIRVLATDGGTPSKQDIALVHVHVNRNMKAPIFEVTDYRVEILETQQLGIPFERVYAKDEDTKVLLAHYTTGLLYIRTSLPRLIKLIAQNNTM